MTKQKSHPTILLSGGHLTPAVATIEYFKKEHPEVKLLFVGREFAQEKERQLAKEREVCQSLGVPFFTARAAKFHRTNWWRNLEEVGKIFPSLYFAWHLIREQEVDLFLSFGGYLAVPFALSAKLLGRKVVTHEQTKTSGLANELIALLADKVAISFEESRQLFPKHKTVVTGNPVRASILRTYTARPSWIPESKKPILYITGGSQGSQIINQSVGQILDELTEKFLVIHQCGQSEHQRYLHELEDEAHDLPKNQQEAYVVREWVVEKELSWIMQHAALVISRSGANTTQEIMLHAVPAIFIPLPFSHNNEQFKNAEELFEAGSAFLLEQKDLDPGTLWAAVQNASANRANMRKRAEKVREQIRVDGAEQLAELCLSLLGSVSWLLPAERWLASASKRLTRLGSFLSSSPRR
jgi:UDP-N-acetylglucosamine--N-acetylmuramyl-(pentapeptide) pyrophosphoryl-undecaprenol N-acetylglucosamine transferase